MAKNSGNKIKSAGSDGVFDLSNGAVSVPYISRDALLSVEALLSLPVVDLGLLSNIIGSDLGLTVEVLQLAALELEISQGGISRIEDAVIHVGVDRLKALCDHQKKNAMLLD
jgi:HD-like signal output (HDOD) protein